MSTALVPIIPSESKIIVIEQTSFPWERQSGENNLWFMRFHDYMMLGPKRSMMATMRQNHVRAGSRGHWKDLAIKWDWLNRAEAYDKHIAEVEETMRFETMHSGLALDWNRVRMLREVAIGEEEIVKAAQAEAKKDPQGLNEALTKRYSVFKAELGKSLEALAAETGGRVKRISVKRDLRSYAVELARSQGYEESVALQIADMVSEEGFQG